MSLIKVELNEINYLDLSEDVRTEVDRIISLATSTLIQRILVTDEYPTVGVMPESKPFIRELINLMTGFNIFPGTPYICYMNLMLDEAMEPVFQVKLVDEDNNEKAEKFVRFSDIGDLYQVTYTAYYNSLAEHIKGDMDMSLIVTKSFQIAMEALHQEQNVFFGIAID